MKNKTKQNSNNIIVPDPSESSDTGVIKSSNKVLCPHVSKSVDRVALRKNLRGNGHIGSRECVDCKKVSDPSAAEDIWLCLQCGVCCCGPEKKNHLLNHFKTPRSDSHFLALKLETLIVSCQSCGPVPVESARKLHTCVDFIKEMRDKTALSTLKKNGMPKHDMVNGSVKNNYVVTPQNKMFAAPNSSVKVKGLSNLGNTCFFNSVLQCLAQTPGLQNVLHKLQEPGQKFTLPILPGQENNSERFSGELDKGGPVSESLLELLILMSKSDNSNGVIVPRKLLAALRKKCPQFEGGDQHDAHELLRHLLDVVRNEDLRRYQRLILLTHGFSTKVNPVSVDEDKKKWMKNLNNKISEEVSLVPDQIFKGMLVSQLQCQTCFHTSNCLEGFLDLSLPVTVEKPVPPIVTRRKNQLALKNEIEDCAEQFKSESCSKRELRQQKKAARNKKKNQTKGEDQLEPGVSIEEKGDCNAKQQLPVALKDQHLIQKKMKNKKKTQPKEEGQGEPRITEDDKKESSDADVEDNDEIGIEDRQIEVLESGYSSEKPSSSRTSPTAETRDEIEDFVSTRPTSGLDTYAITDAIAGLNMKDNSLELEEKQSLLLRRPESGLGSSIVSVQESSASVLGPSEITQSVDSSDSIKGNPSSTSLGLSTESLPEIGSLSRGESISSDHDDTETVVRTCDTLTEDSFVDVPSASRNSSSLELVASFKTDSCEKFDEEKNDFKSVSSFNDDFHLNVDNDLSSCNKQLNKSCSFVKDFYNKQCVNSSNVARSSPVEVACNQTLDCEVLSMSLESYKTEFLSNCNDNYRGGEDENKSYLVANVQSESRGKTDEIKQDQSKFLNGEKANQEMGFVLVGGISENNNELSVSYSKPKSELVLSLKEKTEILSGSGDCQPITVLPYDEENSHRFSEVSPDCYNNGHITLAPRYQCDEGECSVLSCLNHFTAIEMMAGNNKVSCEACTQQLNKGCKNKEPKPVYRVATKRLLISSPPPVLILHLKRFQAQLFSFRKLSCHVSFPLVLDLAPFCSHSVQKHLAPGQTKILYSLYGVVAHSGTLRGGHYVAYVKARDETSEETKPSTGTWYYVSDSHAREISEENVLKSEAYLLFYERFL